MLTHQTYYKHELMKHLQNRIDAEKDALSDAHASIDYPNYKFRVGMIHGLAEAIAACEDVETELQKR